MSESNPHDLEVTIAPRKTGLPNLKTNQDRAAEDIRKAEIDTARLLASAQQTGAITTHVTTSTETDAAADDLVKGYTTPMPVRVRKSVDARGVEEGKSLKYYVLKGLQMQGFPVHDDDLIDQRGSFLKKAAADRKTKIL